MHHITKDRFTNEPAQQQRSYHCGGGNLKPESPNRTLYIAIDALERGTQTRLPVNLQLNTNGSSVRCDASKSLLDLGIRDIRARIGVKTGAECVCGASCSLKSGIHRPYDSDK